MLDVWLTVFFLSQHRFLSTMTELVRRLVPLEEGVPGDVDAIILDESGKTITIQYSGLRMSSADELYHAIYTPVEGTFLVELPFLAAANRRVTRCELNPELIKRPSLLSSATWIAKLHVCPSSQFTT